MHGERLTASELTPYGLAGDRLYAFESSGAPPGMLRVTGSERRQLLRFRAHTALDGAVLVTPPGSPTPLPVDSPVLLARLPAGNVFTLTRSGTPQTDCRPIAILSLATIDTLAHRLGQPLDPRRFRANLLLTGLEPFSEDAWVGCTVRIGATATLRILERDPRCRFITYDPDTTEPLPELMRLLHRHHQSRAGVYAAVVTPGPMAEGDPVTLLH